MWRAYQAFYGVNDIGEEQNLGHVEHILGTPSLGRIHLAFLGGEAVGFSTLYFTFASTRSCQVALLNDLFVKPEHRSAGVGRALLEHALAFTRQERIRFIRWSTQATNLEAQRLYAAYARPTVWNTYSVDLSLPHPAS